MKPTLPQCALVALVPLVSACGAPPTPYVTTVGILKPGATLTVHIESGTLNAYQPAIGQSRNLFTISATASRRGTPPPAPRLRTSTGGVTATASGSLDSLLVRVPDGVSLVVDSRQGDVNVTDITGNARVIARNGNVTVKLPGYAQAATGKGNLSVMMGATTWPGTLQFSTGRGDVDLWVVAKAAFAVRLHTGDGVLFTDFALRGTSTGRSETIDGIVNGGSTQRLDVETSAGAIRLLRLQPQP
jgi:hypothetical protein